MTKQQLEKENELLRKEIELLKKEIEILRQEKKKTWPIYPKPKQPDRIVPWREQKDIWPWKPYRNPKFIL